MNALLSHLAAGELAGFILVLARVSPLFVVAPLFSSRMVPPQVRGIIAVAISIGLAPIALHGQHIPSQPLRLGELAVEGLLTGLGFAFAIAALFAAVESAAAFVDAISGFSFGSLVNSMDGPQSGVVSELYAVIGTAIFLVLGGDGWMLRGISATFRLVPLTSAPRLTSLVGGAEQAFSTIFASALELVAPVLLALLVTDVAFGVVSRVVPQLNVFAIGFPAKVVVALALVSVSLPFLAGWISEQLSISVGDALGALHVA